MIKIGDAVVYVDQERKQHNAIVTCVWPGMSGQDKEPGCNLVYVSGDENRQDSYGRQIERSTSVVHKSNQAAPGFFWDYPTG